jgi:Ca2+-binding RTX toxin-like protein
MAITIKVLTSANVDVRSLLGRVANVDDIDPHGSSRFTGEGGGYKFDVRGSGFQYNPIDIPVSGMVSQVKILKGSSPQLQIDLSPKLSVKTAIKEGGLESFIDSQPIHMTGNSGKDTFSAGKKNDILKGRDGNDTLEGGRGNDTLYGDDGNDTLRGEKGNDKIFGGKDHDTLFGAAGDDVLTGDQGRDTHFGGAGADRFDFNKLADSPVGSGRDTIEDFSRSQGDRIDLRDIDADTMTPGDQKFTFINDEPFTVGVRGQLRQDGNIIQGDVNGNGVADFEIRVLNVAALDAGDFLL